MTRTHNDLDLQQTPEGWLLFPVNERVISRARAMRARRDRLYPNIYAEEATDLRWVGEVGEICMYLWLRAHAPGAGAWIRHRAAGRPDFIVHGKSVGLKTVKRKVPFRSSYTAQITARHAAEPVDYFFFASYEAPRQQLWLLGGITRPEFLQLARYYGAGEQVHADYTVRMGHEIYNIEARHLTPPRLWLEQAREPLDSGPHTRNAE